MQGEEGERGSLQTEQRWPGPPGGAVAPPPGAGARRWCLGVVVVVPPLLPAAAPLPRGNCCCKSSFGRAGMRLVSAGVLGGRLRLERVSSGTALHTTDLEGIKTHPSVSCRTDVIQQEQGKTVFKNFLKVRQKLLKLYLLTLYAVNCLHLISISRYIVSTVEPEWF